jgi:ATP-dependent exoDNAse (exonuclease V) beta subunit
LPWPDGPGRVEHQLPIGIPIALEKMAPSQSDDSAMQRLQDPQLEADLTKGPIVPCVVPQPVELPVLPRAEVAIARAASANRGAGILLHRVLERWDGTADVNPLLKALAAELAADERSIDLVRRRLAIVTASEVFRRIMKAETIGREMPIAFVDESGAVVQKRIDRLIREDAIDTVIDYKSGQPSDARLEKDREQVNVYRGVVAKMTGRPCGGILWYIDAENDVAVSLPE